MQHITIERLHRALITALTPQEKWLRDIEHGRQANTDNDHALKRTAESLARIGAPLATIDAQIRLISLMTRRQMWSCRPGGAA